MIVTMLVTLALSSLGAAAWPFPTLQWLAVSVLVLALSVLVFLSVRQVPLLAIVFGGQRVVRPAPPAPQ